MNLYNMIRRRYTGDKIMSNAISMQLNNKSNTLDQTRIESRQNTVGGLRVDAAQKLEMSSEIEVNGENFVLLSMNGNRANMSNRYDRPNLKPGVYKTTAFNASKESDNEVESTFATALLGALFPVAGLMEHFKHFAEGVHKLNGDASRKIEIETRVNPVRPQTMNGEARQAFAPMSFLTPMEEDFENWKRKKKKEKEALAKLTIDGKNKSSSSSKTFKGLKGF